MQQATHHEAVSALRNAGSCINMKVLRERPPPRGVRDPDEPPEPQDVTGRQLCSQEAGGLRSKQRKMRSADECLSKKIEAAVCNGNGISELEAEALTRKHGAQAGKHMMTIPRIILTHPSISDEDAELLTQIPGREPLHDFDLPDRHVHPDCFDSAFFPP
ncbi:uncharacterized protein LOC133020272 [Limanda limanda]|uniref:uncharacterized protein LOC133020272 n=1 Tax=Limanda limanda TaxID=27771 RepID=UPI0029C999BF|nr:uncharacterized protein LOC133020272 [Limanda limanda]